MAAVSDGVATVIVHEPGFAVADELVEQAVACDPTLDLDWPFDWTREEAFRAGFEAQALRDWLAPALEAEFVGLTPSQTDYGDAPSWRLADGTVVQVGVSLEPSDGGWWIVLSDISAAPSERGGGTKVMDALRSYADQHNVGLIVYKATTDWYSRFDWLSIDRPFVHGSAANCYRYAPWKSR